jgi:hypothetical protein
MTEKHTPGSPFISAVLFWGSVWGLGEATLGHLLHICGVPGLAGFVLFPLGLYFMMQACLVTGRRSAMMGTALVACAIKMVDFVLPGPTPLAVINPSLAILFESLVVMFLLSAGNLLQRKPSFYRLWFISVSWRIGYAMAIWGIAQIFPIPSFLDLGLVRGFQFFLLESLANGLLIFFVFQMKRPIPHWFSRRLQYLSTGYAPLILFLLSVLSEMLI